MTFHLGISYKIVALPSLHHLYDVTTYTMVYTNWLAGPDVNCKLAVLVDV